MIKPKELLKTSKQITSAIPYLQKFFIPTFKSIMILTDISDIKKKYSCIVSLVPSQTELLYDLGLEEEVAGITKFCTHPHSWFINKTRIGGTKNINFKTIESLSPDLIIANKEENVKEQVEQLALHYDVWITDVNNLQDALSMIEDIGTLTGKDKRALELALKIKKGFSDLATTASSKEKINSAYFIWKNPYMVAGGDTFINNMMQYCSLQNIFSNTLRYPPIELKELAEKNCRLILLSSEPYPFKEKHIEEIQHHLPETKIILVDGEMFSWYGSRLLHSINYFQSFMNDL